MWKPSKKEAISKHIRGEPALSNPRNILRSSATDIFHYSGTSIFFLISCSWYFFSCPHDRNADLSPYCSHFSPPMGMLVHPKNVLPQASTPFLAMTFISASFPSPILEITPVSHRLGFGESSPQVMGVATSSTFPLGASPFVSLFSPLTLAHPIQIPFCSSS